MNTVYFPDKGIEALESQAFHGERAKEIRDGKDWAWIKEYIFGSMQDQAVNTLKNSKTEEDRVKAQQMFLASDKPIQLLDFLINQGDAARASLAELKQAENVTLDTEKSEEH